MSDLVNRFTYHPPKEGQPALYESLRKQGRLFVVEPAAKKGEE